MRQWTWMQHVFSLELRKTVSYRAEFWVQFFGSLIIYLGISYFLWQAIFEESGSTTIGGFDFYSMIGYYFMVPFFERMITNVSGQGHGIFAGEIYDGSLSRYLIYPIPVLTFKFMGRLAASAIAAMQLLGALLLYVLLFDLPPSFAVSPQSVMLGIVSGLLGTYVFFLMAVICDMAAFWADNVWSLQVMLRFCAQMLGGGIIPLALFPEWFRRSSEFLPFQFFFSVPIKTFLGQTSFLQWVNLLPLYIIWIVVLSLIAKKVWQKGTLTYGGVGI